MTDRIDAIVIGAGVIGLAVARRLAMAGLETIVLEAADGIGTETSSRNSEVIHAGIYYPKDSLKAALCVAGKHRLYDYCAGHGVPHLRCGKLIVANGDGEAAVLESIRQRGRANGVDDLALLDGAQAIALEPELRCDAALISPSTGVIDSHALMLAYQGEAEDHGAAIAFLCRVERGYVEPGGFTLEVAGQGGAVDRVACRLLVNAAGLHAQSVARRLDGLDAAFVPPQYFCKGSYFSLLGRQPFGRLIYPVPASASLGVHVTVDLGGRVRFGPDQEWVDEIGYDVDPARADVFYEAVRRYWPGLKDGALTPAYAGIRPKVQGPDDPMKDFLVEGPEVHGLAGLVNLFGIESPGLTASLAVADLAAQRLGVNR